MTWHDPNLAPGTLPGKFEVNAHSNDCYTAGGPSKVVGSFTVTDTHGQDVDNPVFEFDVCFDPHSSNTPTGVAVATPPATPTTPPPPPPPLPPRPNAPPPHGPLNPPPTRSDRDARCARPPALPPGRLAAAPDGSINPTLTCSDGDAGCAGTVTATLGHRTLGSATYAIAPGQRTAVHFNTNSKPHGALTLTTHPFNGTAPT